MVGVNAGGGAGGFSTGLEGCGPVGTAVVKGDAGPSTGAARCTGTGFGTKDLGLLTGDRKERGRPRPVVAWGGGGGGGASGITASPGGGGGGTGGLTIGGTENGSSAVPTGSVDSGVEGTSTRLVVKSIAASPKGVMAIRKKITDFAALGMASLPENPCATIESRYRTRLPRASRR